MLAETAEEYDEEEETTTGDLSLEELGPFPILAIFPVPCSKVSFIMSMAGKGAGHLFICHVGSPQVAVVPGMAEGVSTACHSPSGRHFLMGGCTGSVRVYPVNEAHQFPGPTDRYWEGQVHDMHHRVTSVCMSFDSSNITSSASDGSVFTLTLSSSIPEIVAGQRQEGRHNSGLCTIADCPEVEVQDFASAQPYTIEEAKQKLEEDALEAAAEEKKVAVRDMLAQCGPCIGDSDRKLTAEHVLFKRRAGASPPPKLTPQVMAREL
jgi:hypothetical protein